MSFAVFKFLECIQCRCLWKHVPLSLCRKAEQILMNTAGDFWELTQFFAKKKKNPSGAFWTKRGSRVKSHTLIQWPKVFDPGACDSLTVCQPETLRPDVRLYLKEVADWPSKPAGQLVSYRRCGQIILIFNQLRKRNLELFTFSKPVISGHSEVI